MYPNFLTRPLPSVATATVLDSSFDKSYLGLGRIRWLVAAKSAGDCRQQKERTKQRTRGRGGGQEATCGNNHAKSKFLG